MKIVISPAKSLDFESEIPTSTYSQPQFLEEAQKLNAILKKKKPKALSQLMSISDSLAQLNWERNQQFSLPFSPNNARPAVYAFNGDVYQGLDAQSIPVEKLDRLQDTLRILSGLYGILKPLDLMQPYRLEMGTQLKVGRKKNLYEFWKKQLTDHLNQELEEDEVFVNLASNEYFGAVDEKKLNLLDDFERYVRHQMWEKALTTIKDLSASQSSSALLPTQDGFLIDANQRIFRALTSLPPEGREAYRLFYDGKARKEFAELSEKHPL